MSLIIGFPTEEDIYKMIELDRILFGDGGTIDWMHEWYSANPKQWLVAKDEEDNLLGAIGLIGLTKNAFNRLIEGNITERDFTKNDFLQFKPGTKIYCYISGFIVKDKNTRVAISLINKSIAYVSNLKEQGIRIEKIAAIGYTQKGIRLCEKLGLKKIREYDEVYDGMPHALYLEDFKDENLSKIIKSVKEMFLESGEYL